MKKSQLNNLNASCNALVSSFFLAISICGIFSLIEMLRFTPLSPISSLVPRFYWPANFRLFSWMCLRFQGMDFARPKLPSMTSRNDKINVSKLMEDILKNVVMLLLYVVCYKNSSVQELLTHPV